MASSSHDTIYSKPTICVGVPTRGRKAMLEAALKSLSSQHVEHDVSIVVVVIENAAEAILSDTIARLRPANPNIRFHHVHEDKPGIANARNAALAFARREGAHYLAFLDDDEVADRNWIQNLYRELKLRRLHIVGGPKRVFARHAKLTAVQQILLDCLKRRSEHKEQAGMALKVRDGDGKIMLATNNWMADLAFIEANGLQFSRRLNLAGGEDSSFFRQAKQRGARTGWAPDAIVHEEQPPERLTIGYQLKRARDQSIVSYHRKYAERPVNTWVLLPFVIFYGLLLGTIFLLLAPVTTGKTLLTGIRHFGGAVGRAMGSLGIRTQHYSHVTGY